MVSLALLDGKRVPRVQEGRQWEGHSEMGNLCFSHLPEMTLVEEKVQISDKDYS